jgi:hypothetical protein
MNTLNRKQFVFKMLNHREILNIVNFVGIYLRENRKYFNISLFKDITNTLCFAPFITI